MFSISTKVLVFRVPANAAQIAAAPRGQTGVRSVALIAREQVTEARWRPVALAVLDVLSGPLRVLARSTAQTEPVTLPPVKPGSTPCPHIKQSGRVCVAQLDSDQVIGKWVHELDEEVRMSSVVATGGNAPLRQGERAEANVDRWHVCRGEDVGAPLAPRRQVAICDWYGQHPDRWNFQACVELRKPPAARPK